jgi:hypothetical protein
VPEIVTVILAPVALLLQVTVPAQPVAVNVALAPLHKLLLLVAIVGAFGGLPVVITTTFDTGLTPHRFSQVAVYVPAPTTIVLVVAPVLHFKVALQPVAVNVAFSVPQTVVLSGVIVGVVGVGKVLITTGVDEVPSPHSFLHFAV